jgi:hypothetical protein
MTLTSSRVRKYRPLLTEDTGVIPKNEYLLTAACGTLSKQREPSVAGTGTELILQAHVVSFYLVRLVGVLSVIGQNKLACNWSE